MSAVLPPAIAASLREQLATVGKLGGRAEQISSYYRQSATSGVAITTPADALAYAFSRMPATYAAVDAVLAELEARAPDLVPRTLLDAGAGPGTGTWAAVERWPDIERAVLVDRNPHLLDLARTLADAGGGAGKAVFVDADIAAAGLVTDRFDLVLAAYSLTELADTALAAVSRSLWERTAGTFVIVEPGRPRDYARLMTVRAALVESGAGIIAPCPHDRDCPLVAPDWCHFSVRLSRSRDHMRMKGGTLGYEDEKFSYLVAARPGVTARPAAERVIKPPHESKAAVELELCTPAGIVAQTVPSRDRGAFKVAKRLRWGDAAA